MAKGNGAMDLDKKRLVALSQLVHQAVRKLKMGQTGVIPITGYTFEEVRNYVWAYGMHKKKWFDLRFDKTARVIHAERSEPLWERPRPDDDDPDEP